MALGRLGRSQIVVKLNIRSYCSTVLNLIDWTPLINKASVCKQQAVGEAKKKKTVPIVPPGAYVIAHTMQ